jgi:hypothetical protein
METTSKLRVAIGLPSLLVATNLFAGLSTTLYIQPEQPTGYRDTSSYGGEFSAVITGGINYSKYYNSQATAQVDVNGQNVTGVQTFCVEMSTSFQPGQTYSTTVGNSIVSSSGSTPLTVGVAWLYMEFATGGLATAGNSFGLGSADYSYTTGTGRETSADELQDAIWYLQGEINNNNVNLTQNNDFKFSSSNPNLDPFVQLVMDKFGTKYNWSDITYGNNFGVQVLNLYTTNSDCQTVYAQDQLIYCPVPEPANFVAGAMLLLPLGLTALRTLRKKS